MKWDEHFFADRTRRMSASAIREILKIASRPKMVSLAGGIPSPDSFPISIINSIQQSVIKKYGANALQYDLTEGFLPLRNELVHYLEEKGIAATKNMITITSGSQGVLDTAGKILISKGDHVAVEAPTYLGALQAFNPYAPKYVQLETDEHGVLPASIDKALSLFPIKFIYLVPNFQNPTGRTIPENRRKEIGRIIQDRNALLIEDDPYGDLRFRGLTIPPIKTHAPDNVIYVSTLSKVFAPGLRIGFCVAPEQIQKWLVLAKQGVDLHTSTLNQAMATEYLAKGHLKKHLPNIISLYKPRQEAMINALESCFPEGFSWSKPDGGMFVWVKGPHGMDMEKIYLKAVKENVAFVPGKFFFAKKGTGHETMRLNFTMTDEKTIDAAIFTLSRVIKKEM